MSFIGTNRYSQTEVWPGCGGVSTGENWQRRVASFPFLYTDMMLYSDIFQLSEMKMSCVLKVCPGSKKDAEMNNV